MTRSDLERKLYLSNTSYAVSGNSIITYYLENTLSLLNELGVSYEYMRFKGHDYLVIYFME